MSIDKDKDYDKDYDYDKTIISYTGTYFKEDINSTFFKSMLEPQNGVDAIAIALLILHRIILTNTIIPIKP